VPSTTVPPVIFRSNMPRAYWAAPSRTDTADRTGRPVSF
jgi:hypothetical protein